MITRSGQPEFRHLLVPVLGILPVLVAVKSPQSGVAMGTVFFCAYLLSSLITLACRPFHSVKVQWVILVAVTATVVAIMERLLQVWFYSLSLELGIYLPLLAMNGLLLGGLQDYLLPRPFRSAAVVVLVPALTVLLVCAVTGVVRGLTALPVMRNSAGLFLLAALLLAIYNLCARGRGAAAG